MSTVSNNTVISSICKTSAGKISSTERGELITTVCSSMAAEYYDCHALIFKRKSKKPKLMPWCSTRVKLCQGHKRLDILLILDNQSSHMSLEAVLFCRDNGIHLLSIPPRSSHKVQTIDVLQRTGLSFQMYGIMPVNPEVFTKEDFAAPSALTDTVINKEAILSATCAVPSTSATQYTRSKFSVTPPSVQHDSNSDTVSYEEITTSSRSVTKPVSSAEIRPMSRRKDP
ncbi:hypothetical protein PR048_013696 [Dryococelus australis]|uniref:DDE-1 domain-containing protein n=1 Tax=Dryococelus australis TaxID=614101 RepID=A0ABQ9HTQ9_9NEOP|nr:hypothetical protein PR048_013696 [Dryococelus australis]